MCPTEPWKLKIQNNNETLLYLIYRNCIIMILKLFLNSSLFLISLSVRLHCPEDSTCHFRRRGCCLDLGSCGFDGLTQALICLIEKNAHFYGWLTYHFSFQKKSMDSPVASTHVENFSNNFGFVVNPVIIYKCKVLAIEKGLLNFCHFKGCFLLTVNFRFSDLLYEISIELGYLLRWIFRIFNFFYSRTFP